MEIKAFPVYFESLKGWLYRKFSGRLPPGVVDIERIYLEQIAVLMERINTLEVQLRTEAARDDVVLSQKFFAFRIVSCWYRLVSERQADDD